MKKAFTLIELLVSISLLLLLIVFLYKTYNITLSSNQFFDKKVENRIQFNQTKRVLIEDIIEGKILGIIGDNVNSVLLLQTGNNYHNTFYTYVTYFISKENNLLRVESFDKFDVSKLDDSFFNKAFIDIIEMDMKKFKVDALKDNLNAYSIVLEKNSGEFDIFTAVQLGEK